MSVEVGHGGGPGGPRSGRDVFRLPGFALFWVAGTVSEFGSYVTSIAIQTLVVLSLHASPVELGVVNAARWLPYLLLGVLVGTLMDRRRRRPVLVAADVARGALLLAIPLLWALGVLSIPALIVLLIAFGTVALVGDSASQSFLPRLVPRGTLFAANARIDQSSAVAQTAGPAVAGLLVSLIGAPIAVVVDALSYLFSGAAIARLSVDEPRPPAVPRGRLRAEIAEGLRFAYGHRMLRPLAIGTHLWFVVNSMLGTAFTVYALVALRLSPFEFGVALAAAGIGALLGALVAVRLGLRVGTGRAVVICWLAMAAGWVLVAGAGAASGLPIATLPVLAAGQFVYGLGMGAENPNSLGWRQAVTPDGLQGRVNTTLRSLNRGAILIGAPLGGLLAQTLGFPATLLVGAGAFAVLALGMAVSPFGRARHDDALG